jgi:hypothetical protein
MKILIFTDTTKLGDITNELCHLNGDVYIQYVDPFKNQPNDVTGVKWDVALIDHNLRLFPNEVNKWMYFISNHTKRVVIV